MNGTSITDPASAERVERFRARLAEIESGYRQQVEKLLAQIRERRLAELRAEMTKER